MNISLYVGGISSGEEPKENNHQILRFLSALSCILVSFSSMCWFSTMQLCFLGSLLHSYSHLLSLLTLILAVTTGKNLTMSNLQLVDK